MTTTPIPFDQYESGSVSLTPIHPSIFNELSSAHQINTTNSGSIRPKKDKFHPISTVISIHNSFSS
jgi:hypothetical protein